MWRPTRSRVRPGRSRAKLADLDRAGAALARRGGRREGSTSRRDDLATANAAAADRADVLLKGLDERGFVLFTNRTSRKGREALANPRAALTLPWLALQRQILVTGAVSVVSEEESDAYWATRPRGSQIAAASSPQSTVVGSRADLEALWSALAERHPDGTAVPRPPHWGGLRIAPDAVELWEGRPDRLHDRLRYRRTDAGAWVIERLAP